MASIVNKSTLTKEQKEKIVKELTIAEKLPKTYGLKAKNFAKSKPLRVFRADDTSVFLPCAYATSFNKKGFFRNISDDNKDIEFTGTLRPKQEEVVKEIKIHMDKYNTTTLHIHPGFGKSMLFAHTTAMIKQKTMWVHSFSSLNEQLRTTAKSYTTASVSVVGDKDFDEKVDIIICMASRLDKLSDELLKSIKFLVIDECQAWLTNIRLELLLRFTPKYVMAGSATFNKANGLHKAMEMIVGNHKVRVDFEGYFHTIKYLTKIKPVETRDSNGVIMSALRKELATNEARNEQIVNIVKRFKEKKIMILTWLTEHVEILYRNLKENGEDVEKYYGSDESFVDKRVLVSTIAKGGTGLDYKTKAVDFQGVNVDMVVFAMSVKDEGLLEQCLGRGMRAEDPPTFVYLVDSSPVIQRHWKANTEWFIAHNTNVVETTKAWKSKLIYKSSYSKDESKVVEVEDFEGCEAETWMDEIMLNGDLLIKPK